VSQATSPTEHGTPEQLATSPAPIGLAIAVFGGVIIAFSYVADYGPGWTAGLHGFGYVVMFAGFALASVVVKPLRRAMLLAAGSLLFLAAGFFFVAASRGLSSRLGIAFVVACGLVVLLALLIGAVGLMQPKVGAVSTAQTGPLSEPGGSTRRSISLNVGNVGGLIAFVTVLLELTRVLLEWWSNSRQPGS
jgi:hypothetical protein